MRNLFFLFCLLLVWQNGYGQQEKPQSIRTITFAQLEPYLNKKNDTLYLVNFWATWCGPCRKEMPVIEKIHAKYSGKKVKILLVSLDFPNQLQSQLIPYVKNNRITPEVVLLNEPDPNSWIDKVDPKWTGTIPYTLLYGPGFRESHLTSFEFSELDSIINSKL
jgi:thiol-disulfide isomerase/thioredoxin